MQAREKEKGGVPAVRLPSARRSRKSTKTPAGAKEAFHLPLTARMSSMEAEEGLVRERYAVVGSAPSFTAAVAHAHARDVRTPTPFSAG